MDPARGDEPPFISAEGVAMGAATEQFQRMRSSNPWDYARAIVVALRKAGMIVENTDAH